MNGGLARFAAALLSLSCATALAAPVCNTRPAAAGSLRQITAVMASGRFIAYQPTSLQVIDGRLTQADARSIAEDLKVLRPRFDGLITYGARNGAERIADVAARLGYRAIIMGIWDIRDPVESANVIAAAQRLPRLVVGVSVGNERIFAKQADVATIDAAMRALRQRSPQLALATTEPFHIFTQPQTTTLLAQSDLLLANVHPVHQPWFATAPLDDSVQFVANVLDELRGVYCGPILIKETGMPTAPAALGYSPALQARFYAQLEQKVRPDPRATFAWFSAFDAPWRADDEHPVPGRYPEEAHWGLFTSRREPKPVVSGIAPLQ